MLSGATRAVFSRVQRSWWIRGGGALSRRLRAQPLARTGRGWVPPAGDRAKSPPRCRSGESAEPERARERSTNCSRIFFRFFSERQGVQLQDKGPSNLTF